MFRSAVGNIYVDIFVENNVADCAQPHHVSVSGNLKNFHCFSHSNVDYIFHRVVIQVAALLICDGHMVLSGTQITDKLIRYSCSQSNAELIIIPSLFSSHICQSSNEYA